MDFGCVLVYNGHTDDYRRRIYGSYSIRIANEGQKIRSRSRLGGSC